MSVYVDLSRAFNAGRVRAIVASGQAVVLHRLAMASKDGDWILREDEEALGHVLRVLAVRGARYRFGAPLALPWMQGGWSAHLEHRSGPLRVRTDFFTRPPRLQGKALARIWREAEGDLPFLGLTDLAVMKETDRERDWPIIGEIARRMTDPRQQLLHSRSARDIAELAAAHPDLLRDLVGVRPLLDFAGSGRDRLERELDAERRAAMRRNEERLARFETAASDWAAAWPALERELVALSLPEAHARMVARASELLPTSPGDRP